MSSVHKPSAERWVLAVTAGGALMVVLDALVVSTALSTIRADLHISLTQLEWTVNAYSLSFAVLLMTGAMLGDRLGRRRIFCAGIGLFVAGSAGCALSPSVAWLIAGRVVQGAGAALVMPAALTLVGVAFSPSRRPRALGAFAGITGAAVPLGPLLGGAVVQGISWPWIFWLNVPVGLGLVVLALTRIEESYGARVPVDGPGLALVTGAALGIIWGLVRGNPAGWTSPEVSSALILGLLSMIGFAAWEQRTSTPMLPLRLFASRRFSAGNAAAFLHNGSAIGAAFFIAQFLQTGLGYGPLTAGLGLMPWGATTLIVPRIVGGLINRFGERRFVVMGMSLHGASMLWIALIATPRLPYWQLIAPLVLSGAGLAMSLPATQSSVLSSVAPPDIGSASGTFSTLRQLGAAFGVAILAAVFAAHGSYRSAHAFSNGFAAAIAAGAALAFTAALTGSVLPGRRPATSITTSPLAPAPVLDADT